MNTIVFQILAVVAIIILALSLSGTDDGAKLVQFGLVIAIVAVVLGTNPNSPAHINAIIGSFRDLTKNATALSRTQSSS